MPTALVNDSGSLIRFARRGNAAGYLWFADPSLVRVVDNQLCFGRRALRVTTGMLVRSLKMELLPPDTDSNYEHPDFPPGVSPDLLIACYISRVLRLIRRTVQDGFGIENIKILLNMAAPMDQFENESLKSRDMQIISSAWESVFGTSSFEVRNGVRIDEARGYFWERLQMEVESRASRPFDVQPETIAPIVSMQDDPRMAPGLYSMLDMGAGTSEFSVNFVNERGADQKVVCYYDRTKRIAGDDVDHAKKFDSDPA